MKRIVIGGGIAAVLLIVLVYFALDLFLVRSATNESTPMTINRNTKPGYRDEDIRLSFTQSNPIPTDIKEFVHSVAGKVRRKKIADVCSLFDTAELYSNAQLVDLAPAKRLPLLIGIQSRSLFQAITETFDRIGFGLPWDDVRVCHVFEVTKDCDFVVYCRHVAGDHAWPVRWTIKKQKASFAITELEDLLTGMRFSEHIAIQLGTTLDDAQKRDWPTAARQLRTAMALLFLDRKSIAHSTFESFPTDTTQPKFLLDQRARIEGIIAAEVNDRERASPLLKQLGHLPIGDLMMTVSKQPLADSSTATSRYEEMFGTTPLSWAVRIDVSVNEKKWDEANELLNQALLLYPDSPTLHALAWSLQ